jgi:dihydropteroate synthase
MTNMPFAARARFDWQLRTRALPLGIRTGIMGVVNITPDSFSDGGSLRTPAEAIERALAMFEEGADIVDIGGESTRPGTYKAVTISEETKRVLPVIEGVLRHRPASVLSIDTYHAATAQAAVQAGVEIVNDVSGFLWDPSMASVCAAAQCGVVLMHTRGRPADWQTLPPLLPAEVVPLVLGELQARLREAENSGIAPARIVLDPGLGFGKVFDQNYSLLAGFEQLAVLNQPLLAGPSRKGFLGRTLAPLYQGKDAPVDRRASASLAAVTAAVLGGAHLIRVHDVRPSREAASIADALLQAGA